MANYQLEQTGAEVQALLNAVESPDTTPAAGSSNLITSGAVQAAVAGVSAEVTALGHKVSEIEYDVSGSEVVGENSFIGGWNIGPSNYIKTNNNKRVGIEEFRLSSGDSVILTDYTKCRMYIGWKDDNNQHGAQGWLSQDFTASVTGTYVVTLEGIPAAVLADKTDLTKYFRILRADSQILRNYREVAEVHKLADNTLIELDEKTIGLDILSLPYDSGYYINGSGTKTNNGAYRTIYLDRSYFGADSVIVGYQSFVHFYNADSEWLSCFKSWNGDNYTRIKTSDIPANCSYIVISWDSARQDYMYLFDAEVYFNTQRLSPLHPAMRIGSARYQTANYIAQSLILPTYGAVSVRISIATAPGTGYNWLVECSLYNQSGATSLNVAPDRQILADKPGASRTINSEGYDGFVFVVSKIDGSGTRQTLMPSNIPLLDITIERIFIPEELDGIMHNDAYIRNRDKESALAAAVRFNKKSNGYKDFMSLIITDSHNDATAERNSIVMADNFQYVQSLIHCGDLCSDNATNFDATIYNEFIACSKPFYFVAGNHDVGNSKEISKCITNAQYYTRYVQPLVDAGLLSGSEYGNGNGYYYHDFTSQKIRLIVLYEYDDPNDVDPNDNTSYIIRRGDSVIRQAQAQWFCATLNSTPAGYGVVVAMHNPFSAKADCVTTAKFNHPAWVNGHGAQRLFSTDLWADIVDAWVNKSANYSCSMVCTGDAAYLNTGGEYYSFTYDFSGRENTAKFICFIGGHVHEDCVWRHQVYTYQYQITPICANTIYWAQCPNADIRRTNTDGPSKDSLTAIGYDYDNQAIRLVKLGVNVTENMVARDYELIETQE